MDLLQMPDTEDTIKVLLGFTVRQWAVIVMLTASIISGGVWVEDRYAKIKDVEETVQATNTAFQQSKQQIEQAHFLSLEIFSKLPKAQRDEIMAKMNLVHSSKNTKAK